MADYIEHYGMAKDDPALLAAAPDMFNALVNLSAVLACDTALEADQCGEQLGITDTKDWVALWRDINDLILRARGKCPLEHGYLFDI